MKITGELLKSERLRKDLKIQDVAYALKLNSRIVTALEEGDLENLPSKTFIRGFVKSYADYLKLDSNVVLRQFQEEMGSTHPVPRSPPPLPEGAQTPAAPAPQPTDHAIQKDYSSGFNQKNTLIFIGVAVSVLIIAGINQVISKYQKEAQLSPTQSDSNAAQSAAVTASSDSTAAISNSTVPASTDATTSASSADSTTALAVSSDSTQVKSDFPALETSAAKPVEVLIEAKKDVLVEYSKGNSTAFQKMSLKKSNFQIIRSGAGLHLRISDGSAVHLTVNGISKGLAGANDKPVQVTY